MRVLHVVGGFYPATRFGGPSESVLRLNQGLMAAGHEVEVVTTDADGPTNMDIPLNRIVPYEGVPVRYFGRFPRIGYMFSLGLTRYVTRVVRDYDLVHVTSLFSYPSTAAAIIAHRQGVPYVMSPRGMCMPWELSYNAWKKQPYWHAIDKPVLRRAGAVHATADLERDHIKELVPSARVIVVPNAIELPDPAPRVPVEAGRIVFLGRLAPKKGFDVLIPAMRMLAKQRPDAELVIAGPDDMGEWARTEALIAQQQPRPRVRYVGAVHGDEKTQLLASAQVMVLSSHSENFGVVVLEALACGTPVVVSKNCPWRAVEEEGAGFWVDNTPAEVAGALAKVLAGDPGSYRGAALRLASRYGHRQIGAVMAEHYREIVAAHRAG